MDPLLLAIIIAFVVALASSSSYSSAPAKPPPRSKPKDTPILLISGRIDDPNIKDIDVDAQTLLKKDNLAFSQAVAYDRETLLKMKQHPVPSKEPKETAFSGPLLSDVLKDAKAKSTLFQLRSLTGASKTLTEKELQARPWILALSRGETPLMLGANGPLLLLHEPASGTSFTPDEEKTWLPAIYYIDAR
jgi:hypothetical protein